MILKCAEYSKLVGIWVLAVLLLSGCGNRYEEKLRLNHQNVQTSINYLKTELDNSQLINALLINKYASALIRQKPDYEAIVNLLKKEGTSAGKAFLALNKRLSAVNLLPQSKNEAAISANELAMISAAADPLEFNNALADVVNTIASMSDGELAVINVPPSKTGVAQNTNALVGNPAYGNWQRNSSGQSFWAWYGMYSMFNNVMGGGRGYYYNSWSSRPNYGYYNSYGRNRWGSSADVSRNYNLSKSNPTKYNRPSAATKSRYSKVSSRSSRFGSSKYGSSKGSGKSSSYGSSSRSSSFSSSRSSFSGK